jgi:hypothetical protein
MAATFRHKLAPIVGVVLILSGIGLADARNVLTAVIRDPQGLYVSKANVYVRPSFGSNRTIVPCETDPSGSCSFDLNPGTYDVFVSAAGFIPSARQVEIISAQTTRLDFKLDIAEHQIAIFDPADSNWSEFYAKHLHAMKEPWPLKIERLDVTESYRFLYLRSFDPPIAIRINLLKDGSGELLTKITRNKDSYEPGILVTNTTHKLTKKDSEWFLLMVEEEEFWTTPRFPTPSSAIGVDGAQWVFEGVKNGNHHIVERWSPQAGKMHDLGIIFLIHMGKLKLLYQDVY